MKPVAVFAVALVLSAPARAEPPHSGFVDAAEVVAGLRLDMRYYGEHNFVGRRIDGYEAPRCLLTRRAAAALARVQQDLAATGFGLKVFDCYRPVRAVADFVRWARDPGDKSHKAEFYPEIDKGELFRAGYISARSGHSRGSTVDLTLVRLSDGEEIDMGSPFDFFGTRSSRANRSVSQKARANRNLLAAAMRRRGFVGYRKEWWHFSLANEPYPTIYFDFPVR